MVFSKFLPMEKSLSHLKILVSQSIQKQIDIFGQTNEEFRIVYN